MSDEEYFDAIKNNTKKSIDFERTETYDEFMERLGIDLL